MHDWTLQEIYVNWASASAKIEFLDSESKKRTINIEGLIFINSPRKNPWGESVSVNEVVRATSNEGRFMLSIEMQSGDTIELEAAFISDI